MEDGNEMHQRHRSGCVVVAMLADGAMVRHSQDPDGLRLRFATAEWDAFVDGSKNNEFDREDPLLAWR